MNATEVRGRLGNTPCPAVGCTRKLHMLEVRIGEVCMQSQQNGGIRFVALSATRCFPQKPFLVQSAALLLAQKLKLGDSKTNVPVLTQIIHTVYHILQVYSEACHVSKTNASKGL